MPAGSNTEEAESADATPSESFSSLSWKAKTAAAQTQMRTCQQQPDDFEDEEVLWGYAAEKFAQRAGMTFDALTKSAPASLRQLLALPRVHVAAFGGGPAAELLGAVVARDLAGGGCGEMVVYEWVEGWRPIVETVGAILGEKIGYRHCDVSQPLDHESNAALRAEGVRMDLIVFSHVLLECGRGGGAAPLALLRDLWLSRPEISHALVLDAGQVRGRGRKAAAARGGPLAGSLREVEVLAADLGAGFMRVEGHRRVEGVLLTR